MLKAISDIKNNVKVSRISELWYPVNLWMCMLQSMWTMWIYESWCQVSPGSAIAELLMIAELGPWHYLTLV